MTSTKLLLSNILTQKIASSHNIKPGNHVLIANKPAHKNKFTLYWDPNLYKVNAVKGNSIIIQKGSKPIMQTSAQVKLYKSSFS